MVATAMTIFLYGCGSNSNEAPPPAQTPTTGTVSVSLTDGPWEDAMEMVLHVTGMEIGEFKDGKLDNFQSNYVIKLLNSLEEENEGTKVVSLRRLQDQMKQDQEIDEGAIQSVLDATEELQMEPEQFFNRNKFFEMYTELLNDKQLGDKMKKALAAFEDDKEWAEALQSVVEGKHAPAPLEAQVQAAIKQLTPEAQYSGGVQIAIAEDGSVVAQIKAPYPFFYRFEHGAGELVLLEAAMQVCNRMPFVSKEDGNLGLQEELLKADVYLAAAFGNAAGQDTPKGTRPKDAKDLARDFVDLVSKMKDESAPDKKAPPAAPA